MNRYYIQHIEMKVIWKYLAHSGDSIWIERMGDKLVRSLKIDEFIELFSPIKGERVVHELNYLTKSDLGHVRSWIYDIVSEVEGSGSWLSIYRTTLHEKTLKRDALDLYTIGAKWT